MILEFYIPGQMTSLNDYVAAMNRNRYDGAKIKKMETGKVALLARGLPSVDCYPVDLRLTWYRADRKTDPDNVAFAIKFILDGLQVAGIIKQDTWACVRSITHVFALDASNPGVEVVISDGVNMQGHIVSNRPFDCMAGDPAWNEAERVQG